MTILDQEKQYNYKALATSLIVHAGLLLVLFYFSFSNFTVTPKEETYAMQMIDFTEPEEIVEPLPEPQTFEQTTESTAKTPAPTPTTAAKGGSKSSGLDVPKTSGATSGAKSTKNNASAHEQNSDEQNTEVEYAKSKQKFGSLLNKGSKNGGSESGNSGTGTGSGSGSGLDGLTKGSGKVSGGLASRKLLFQPTISDQTQKVGSVIIAICVKADGNVSSATFTQQGSTTTDAHLVNLAEKAAKKYKFEKSTLAEQCGTVVIKFVLN